MHFAILRLWPEAGAVGQNCIESVKVGADSVGMFVDHETGKILAHALAHDARFAVMHGEAFFSENRGHEGGEPAMLRSKLSSPEKARSPA